MPSLIIYTSRKKELFRRLRGELMANGLSNADIGQLFNKSACHVSRCLNGKAQFNLDEQYLLMDAIHRPYCDLHIIFPPGGRDSEVANTTTKITAVR